MMKSFQLVFCLALAGLLTACVGGGHPAARPTVAPGLQLIEFYAVN